MEKHTTCIHTKRSNNTEQSNIESNHNGVTRGKDSIEPLAIEALKLVLFCLILEDFIVFLGKAFLNPKLYTPLKNFEYATGSLLCQTRSYSTPGITWITLKIKTEANFD